MYQGALAQESPPVLRANSRTVDIRDGSRFLKGGWTVDPAVALDVYVALRADEPKRVAFISDVDSLSLDVQPGRTYDFIVLLNGTEPCRTRISTRQQGYRRTGPGRAATPDTIPFRTRHGRIHIQARVNDSPPIDLMFDTGANIVALRPSALARGAKIKLDGSVPNISFGGTTTQETSSGNRLSVAGLVWDNESMMYFDDQAHDASDGILGYNVFEDKLVEIDQDQSVLIIHDRVPAMAAGYARPPLRFTGGLPTVETTFNTGQEADRGWFVIDTGATAALQLKQDFARAHDLYGAMRRIGSSTSRGAGGGKVRNEVVLLPELALGDFVLHNVPTHLESPAAAQSLSSGCLLGMEVLGRCNMILDYQHNDVYLRPSARFNAAFRTNFAGRPRTLVVAGAVVAVALLAGLILVGARRRKNARVLLAAREERQP